MRWAFPWAFLLLLPLLKRAIDHLQGGKRPALSFSTLEPLQHSPQTFRQRFLPMLFWLHFAALFLLILALARPQKKEWSTSIPHEGVAIELVVDVSSSMEIPMPFKDTSLSRIEVTKQVLEEFAKGRPNDLLGLIIFARYADTICPLTLSHDPLFFLIQELQIENRPNEDGTAFGDALALAAARLQTTELRYGEEEKPSYTIQSKVIVLLTDGNNNCGRHLPLEGAALAKKWGIRIHAISITDPPETKTIQTTNGPQEVEIDPPPQERVLKKIAETTGGIYRRATDEASLHDIYRQIDEMEQSEIETTHTPSFIEIFTPFALTGLFLLLLHTLLSTTWLRRAP